MTSQETMLLEDLVIRNSHLTALSSALSDAVEYMKVIGMNANWCSDVMYLFSELMQDHSEKLNAFFNENCNQAEAAGGETN